ncbi:hypothetical protein GCM10027596_03060 [Nocardioides korecus]
MVMGVSETKGESVTSLQSSLLRLVTRPDSVITPERGTDDGVSEVSVTLRGVVAAVVSAVLEPVRATSLARAAGEGPTATPTAASATAASPAPALRSAPASLVGRTEEGRVTAARLPTSAGRPVQPGPGPRGCARH